MGENTLQRTHPLQAWEEAFARLPEGLQITVEPYLAMAVSRGDHDTEVNTWRETDDGQVVWLGPDELLVTSTVRSGEQLEADLPGTDVSAQRISLRLSGSHARELLTTGTSHDLHPSVFGAGRSVQTTIAMTGVVLISLRDNDYRILVRSSFAGYLAGWLLDAALEFTP
ncbi:sarcosine oxidase subunit gamma [Kineosporia succinea]|uniref:Sarcosine oxidase subunit gamma n=1 Tax=Kineosporia succinea TaxID=84632 RepID=A0ABT9PD83_9ACTN|nr:sarcosine oxidase subunit gamma family protein [Kineosporia succinea]MDP9830658.1 sarcosine oxidase subunit gamma [Kineosporia succinea]